MFTIFVLCHLLANVYARLVSFEQLATIPHGWKPSNYPPLEQNLKLDIYISPASDGELEQMVLSRSIPGDARYGIHLELNEIIEMQKPPPDITIRIAKWLKEAGIEDIEWEPLQASFHSTISQAESLLNTTFQTFEDERGNVIVRALSYSIPSDLVNSVEMIQPTTRFPQARWPSETRSKKRAIRERQAAVNFSNCSQFVSPSCLRKLYKIGDAHIKPNIKNTLAVISFDFDYAQYSDLTHFQKKFAPWVVGHNYTWTSIDGQ